LGASRRRAGLRERDHDEGYGDFMDTMIMIDGKSYRCFCGCNVFHPINCEEHSRVEYICNACQAIYVGTDKKGRVGT